MRAFLLPVSPEGAFIRDGAARRFIPKGLVYNEPCGKT
jgi:hypothetical protein